jgi:hypothetical protein
MPTGISAALADRGRGHDRPRSRQERWNGMRTTNENAAPTGWWQRRGGAQSVALAFPRSTPRLDAACSTWRRDGTDSFDKIDDT